MMVDSEVGWAKARGRAHAGRDTGGHTPFCPPYSWLERYDFGGDKIDLLTAGAAIKF